MKMGSLYESLALSTKSLLVITCCLLLTACGGRDMSDLEAYVAEVRARPKTPIKPLPEIQMVETFVFDPEGLRDPFVPAKVAEPPRTTMIGSGIKPDLARPKEELESYALDSLRMVGTVKKDGELWALIGTTEGTIYRVRPGNYLGRNHGKIVRILDDRVEIVEIVPDAPGTWRERQAALALAE